VDPEVCKQTTMNVDHCGVSLLTYVEDKKRVFSTHDFRRAVVGDFEGLFVPPLISPGGPRNGLSCALKDKDVLDERARLQRGIDNGLCGDGLAAPAALVGGDDDAALAILHTVAQRLG
jgi:hypothetical protein